MSHAPITARASRVLLWLVMVSGPSPAAAAGAQIQTAIHRLLDVPYVAQTPELCGGAAVAMVLRYWGERQVFPEDFAPLVVASERGIPTGVLADAVRGRHWQAVIVAPRAGDPHARIREAVDDGQPLIALIEVSPRTYHYVVIVGTTDREIVVHDPARAPFRVLPWDAFDRAWIAAGQWTLLVLPPGGVPAAHAVSAASGLAAPASTRPATPCEGLVEQGVSLALGGEGDAAEQVLFAATRMCPTHPAAWRELAGLRFKQSRYAESAALALTAVQLSPNDPDVRDLLATSRYLAGDLMGALDAWTPLGQPRIDAITIHGVDRTPHPVVAEAAGLQPREVLTSGVFKRALRRVQALPVVASARMQYEPLEGGLASVDVSLAEREPYPRGWVAFTVLGGRAAIGHELKVETAGLLGAGERVTAAGRWQTERPRVALGLAFPSPGRLPGVVTFDGMWERQSYPEARPSRRRMALQLTDWSTSGFRWRAGVAVDRFGARRTVSVDGGVDVRLGGDRLAVMASRGQWLPTDGGRRFATGSLLAAWRSTADTTRGTWSAMSEVSLADRAAPLALWEGAGTGSARAGLLRAHPLLHDGVLTGPAFGRTLARGTVEYARPVASPLPGAVSIAGFVDAAQAWHRLAGPGPSPLYVDLGVGLRVRMPGRVEGLRIDVAHGLRGGGLTLSAGVLAVWPR